MEQKFNQTVYTEILAITLEAIKKEEPEQTEEYRQKTATENARKLAERFNTIEEARSYLKEFAAKYPVEKGMPVGDACLFAPVAKITNNGIKFDLLNIGVDLDPNAAEVINLFGIRNDPPKNDRDKLGYYLEKYKQNENDLKNFDGQCTILAGSSLTGETLKIAIENEKDINARESLITQAHRNANKLYHPDTLSASGQQNKTLVAILTKLSAQLQEAKNNLLNPIPYHQFKKEDFSKEEKEKAFKKAFIKENRPNLRTIQAAIRNLNFNAKISKIASDIQKDYQVQIFTVPGSVRSIALKKALQAHSKEYGFTVTATTSNEDVLLVKENDPSTPLKDDFAKKLQTAYDKELSIAYHKRSLDILEKAISNEGNLKVESLSTPAEGLNYLKITGSQFDLVPLRKMLANYFKDSIKIESSFQGGNGELQLHLDPEGLHREPSNFQSSYRDYLKNPLFFFIPKDSKKAGELPKSLSVEQTNEQTDLLKIQFAALPIKLHERNLKNLAMFFEKMGLTVTTLQDAEARNYLKIAGSENELKALSQALKNFFNESGLDIKDLFQNGDLLLHLVVPTNFLLLISKEGLDNNFKKDYERNLFYLPRKKHSQAPSVANANLHTALYEEISSHPAYQALKAKLRSIEWDIAKGKIDESIKQGAIQHIVNCVEELYKEQRSVQDIYNTLTAGYIKAWIDPPSDSIFSFFVQPAEKKYLEELTEYVAKLPGVTTQEKQTVAPKLTESPVPKKPPQRVKQEQAVAKKEEAAQKKKKIPTNLSTIRAAIKQCCKGVEAKINEDTIRVTDVLNLQGLALLEALKLSSKEYNFTVIEETIAHSLVLVVKENNSPVPLKADFAANLEVSYKNALSIRYHKNNLEELNTIIKKIGLTIGLEVESLPSTTEGLNYLKVTGNPRELAALNETLIALKKLQSISIESTLQDGTLVLHLPPQKSLLSLMFKHEFKDFFSESYEKHLNALPVEPAEEIKQEKKSTVSEILPGNAKNPAGENPEVVASPLPREKTQKSFVDQNMSTLLKILNGVLVVLITALGAIIGFGLGGPAGAVIGGIIGAGLGAATVATIDAAQNSDYQKITPDIKRDNSGIKPNLEDKKVVPALDFSQDPVLTQNNDSVINKNSIPEQKPENGNTSDLNKYKANKT